jgi:4'-phosphopantetheinyl transferase
MLIFANSPSSQTVEVCYLQTAAHDERYLTQLLMQLRSDERVSANRFALAKDRLAFALGRLLVRKMLSLYTAMPPGRWEFVCNRYGKPDLRLPSNMPQLRFNISHCDGMVAAAFAVGHEIGVDVESLDRKLADPEIARRYFAPEETNFLESLQDEQRSSAFFSFWTLKEAYIKARGMGLSIPLADFAFSLNPIRISFSSRLQDEPSDWLFRQQNLTPSHVLALAVRRHPEETVAINTREVTLEALL